MFTRRSLPRGTLVLTLVALTLFLLTGSKLNDVTKTSTINTSTTTTTTTTTTATKGGIYDWLFPHTGEKKPPLGSDKSHPNQKCKQDPSLEYLRSLDLSLSDTFNFSRRCIKPIITPNLERASVTNISGSFFGHQTEVSLSLCHTTAVLPPCESLSLPVPPPYSYYYYDNHYHSPQQEEEEEEQGKKTQQKNFHLLLGVASTYERIQSSLPAFKHWLANSNKDNNTSSARLIIVISDVSSLATKHTLPDLEAEYRRAGMQATVIPPRVPNGLPRKGETEFQKNRRLSTSAPVEELHFLLVADLLEYATEETRWLGILDDDTFFPDLYPLSKALSGHDHTKNIWLGGLADNWYSLLLFGHQALGGAGIFLSLPLARSLSPHLHDCVFESNSKTGDSLLRDCIASQTSTTLTVLPGLNQHDLRGDASGWFESNPNPVLSLHHWKSWYRAPVTAISAITKICGDCFLRRYRFDGDDTVWVNGYSVSKYAPGMLEKIDLDKVEGTWEGAEEGKGGGFESYYGELRPRLGENEIKRWKLVDARFEEEGKRLRQVYVWKDDEWERSIGRDGVVEILWEV